MATFQTTVTSTLLFTTVNTEKSIKQKKKTSKFFEREMCHYKKTKQEHKPTSKQNQIGLTRESDEKITHECRKRYKIH